MGLHTTQWCAFRPIGKRPPKRYNYGMDAPHPGIAPVEEDEKDPVFHDETLTFMTPESDKSASQTPLNLETGMFTSPSSRKYLVTLTAMLNTPTQKKMRTYAQLFLRKNGKVTSLDDYLLVEHGKVTDLRTEVQLSTGDTLSVYVGRQVDRKYG